MKGEGLHPARWKQSGDLQLDLRHEPCYTVRREGYNVPDKGRISWSFGCKASFPDSYADAFAVGLAQETTAEVVTSDPEFRQDESMVSVVWI